MLYSIKPVVGSTALTCATTVGSKTVTSSAQFGSVVAGQRIVGAGIPFNTLVSAKATTSSITISKAATATSASVSLQFGYHTAAIYAAGDALGFPFMLPMKKVNNVIVVDGAKIITAVKLLMFSGEFVECADNAAFAITDADAAKLCGYLSLAVSEVLSNNQIVTGAATQLPILLPAGGTPTCQLICVGTPTTATVGDFTVNFVGE